MTMPQSQPSRQVGRLVALNDDVLPAEFYLEEDHCIIGRHAETCQIVVVNNKRVSRHHARIERYGPRLRLHDTNSTNGTFVNGSRIYRPHLLKDRDRIGLASATALLQFFDPDPTDRSSSPLRYDERMLSFFWQEKAIPLPPNQFRLLLHLYHHPLSVCTHQSCAQAIWQQDYQVDIHTNESLHREMRNLRRSLRQVDPKAAEMIQTRRGQGYIFTQSPAPV